MKKTLTLILTLVVGINTFAQIKNNVTKSSITFKIKNLGFNTSGNFSGLVADVQFKPDNLPASSIEASVDAATINTDNGTRDKHLKSDDYFDVEKYPKITMKSVSFKHNSGNNYTGQFNVSIKDKTKLISVPFTYNDAGGTAALKGSFKIKRSDFGIGGSNLILADEATITVEAEITR